MKIEYLSMQNFMPYKGENKIEFPLDDFANTTIFFGENTKGKTSILNAFRWCLYGKAEQKGKELTYEEFLNLEAKEHGDNLVKVEIGFVHDDKEFVVTRSLESISQKNTGKFIVLRDGVPLNLEDAKHEIEKIAPLETSRFFLFDGELLREYEALMEKNSPAGNRIKKSIEDVMGFPDILKSIDVLDIVEKALSAASKNEKSTDKALNELKQERNDISDQITIKLTEKETLEKEKQLKNEELKKIATDLQGSEELKAKYDDLQMYKNRRDDFKETRIHAKNNIDEMKKGIWRSVLKSAVSNTVEPAQQIGKKRSKIEAEISGLKHECSTMESFLETGICPTCGQESRVNNEFQKKIEVNKETISKKHAELGNLPDPDSWIKLGVKFNDARTLDDYFSAERTLEKLQIDIDDIVKKIKEVQEEIGDFDGEKITKQLVIRIRLEESLSKIDSDIEKLDKEISELKSTKLSLTQKINENESKEGASSEAALLYAEQINSIFEKAKDILREDIKEEVERSAEEAFLEMTSRPDDYSGLKINDSYGLEIIANDGSIVPQRSAGAEQVVALALIIGLNRVGKSAGPVIMDTPFGRLDETHRAKIMAYMPKFASQFMVFVHSGELRRDSEIMPTISSTIGRTYEIKSSGPFVSYIEQGA